MYLNKLIVVDLLLSAIGMGLCSSSFSLAMNSYFKERRNKAFGIGATITGLGPIFLPQLVTFLLSTFGTQGCVLIIGGMAMNIVAAALLLQPVKWHQKKSSEVGSSEERDSLFKPQPSISRFIRNRKKSIMNYLNVESFQDIDTNSSNELHQHTVGQRG